MNTNEETDFTQIDDSTLINLREEMRAELDLLPPYSPGHALLSARYELSTAEINERARVAWAKSTPS